MSYLAVLAKQPSTWRGIVMLLGAAGVLDATQGADLERAIEIIAVAMGGSGIIGAVTSEKR